MLVAPSANHVSGDGMFTADFAGRLSVSVKLNHHLFEGFVKGSSSLVFMVGRVRGLNSLSNQTYQVQKPYQFGKNQTVCISGKEPGLDEV